MSATNQTFLELCQEMAAEVGIPGGGPSTTVGQSGEYKRLVTYIQNADMDIQRMYIDWEFLWSTFTGTLVLNDNSVTGAATDINQIKKNAVWVDYGTAADAYQLDFVNWNTFVDSWLATPPTAGQPTVFSISPANAFRIARQPNATYAGKEIYVEYYQLPTKLTTDAQTSTIPKEFRRIIVARAILQYSFVEDAPEIQPGAVAEFDSMLHQLESRYLTDMKGRTMGSAEAAGYGIDVITDAML